MIEDNQFQPSMAMHLTVASRKLRNCVIKVQENRLWTAVKYAKQEIFSLLKTSIKFLTFVEREFLGTDMSWTVTGIFVSWFLESFSLHLYLHKWIELFLNSFSLIVLIFTWVRLKCDVTHWWLSKWSVNQTSQPEYLHFVATYVTKNAD